MSKDKAQADDSSIPFLNLAEFFETVAPGTRVTVSGIPIAATYNPIGPPPLHPNGFLNLTCTAKNARGCATFSPTAGFFGNGTNRADESSCTTSATTAATA